MSSVQFSFECTFCQEKVTQGPPADSLFYLQRQGNIIEPIQQSACSKCAKKIKENNDPIEKILEAQDREDAKKQPALKPSGRAKVRIPPQPRDDSEPAPPAEEHAQIPTPQPQSDLINVLQQLAAGQSAILEALQKPKRKAKE